MARASRISSGLLFNVLVPFLQRGPYLPLLPRNLEMCSGLFPPGRKISTMTRFISLATSVLLPFPLTYKQKFSDNMGSAKQNTSKTT